LKKGKIVSTEDYAQSVNIALTKFVGEAKAALGDDLKSIVLYGSAAEDKLRVTSDVNIVMVLNRFSPEKIDPFREPFRLAHASIRLTAMFLLGDEIPAAAEAFAVKFGDIHARHRVLFGDDPFLHLDISRAATVRRLQQVLLNLVLRLRHEYVLSSLREEQAAFAIADAAGPLRASAQTILQLESRAAPSPKEALQTLIGDADFLAFAPLLAQISVARETGQLPPGTAAAALAQTISLTEVLHQRATKMMVAA
jgi:predicted nucleotidyltransferase